MTVSEVRTYTPHVGKTAEAFKLYVDLGYPALEKGGQDKKLIGYFQTDTGMINKLIHLWEVRERRRSSCANWAATVVRCRFERLCRFLADCDRYATAVFSRTHPESLLGADGVAPLRPNVASTAWRYVEQVVWRYV